MAFLPAPIEDDSGALTPRQLAGARRAQASTELEVYRYFLRTRALADIDRLDSQAIADASRAALEEECSLLDYGLAQAGQSAAKAMLFGRHVERMATINDRRITRRFGG